MTRHHFLPLAFAWLLLTIGPLALAEQNEPAAPSNPPTPEEPSVAALIDELDSNRYLERERATQALLAAGTPALDPLLAAANGDRPEAADRAVWVLKKLGDATDREFALAALDRLVKVNGRPAVVSEAKQVQSRLRLSVCQEKLAKLGGRLSMVDVPLADVGLVPAVRVELGDDWRGSLNDLKCLLELDQQQFFRLVGPAVSDEEVKLFESKDGLRLLQVFMTTNVMPATIDALKERQPKAIIYVRNRALLGIQGESQANGVRVVQAQDKSGAANAGITANDVVVKIDGKPIKDFDRLTALIAKHEPGDMVDVTILRGEETLTKQVTLGDQPPE